VKNRKWRVYIPGILPPIEPQRKILAGIAEMETGLAGNEAELIARVSRADALLLTLKTRLTRKVME
jgi:hypothetical protein